MHDNAIIFLQWNYYIQTQLINKLQFLVTYCISLAIIA